MLLQYLFKVANALLTVPRALCNSASNPTLLQLEIIEEGIGTFLTYRKSFGKDEIGTWED